MPPKIDWYALIHASRLAKEHPENAGEYMLVAGALIGGVYICRRWVFGYFAGIAARMANRYPRSASIINKMLKISAFITYAIVIVAIVGGIGFVVYTFCSNLFGDLAARNK